MKSGLFLMTLILSASPAFAMHIYAGSSCKNATLKVNYDGPGSNYAYGGYSNFYAKDSSGKEIKILAQEAIDPIDPEDQASIGDIVNKDNGTALDIIFDISDSKKISESQPSLKAGDSCKPYEIEYQHQAWTTNDTIEIKEISTSASAKLGLKQGDKVQLSCEKTYDIPVRCPESGKYNSDIND